MPDGYGVEQATAFVSWQAIEEKLRDARHYWLATTRPGGGPHVIPRWGIWLDSAFWYDGSPETAHVRNLREDPRCVLHLEDGQRATIVEGHSIACDPILGEMGECLAAEFARKYASDYAPHPDAWSDESAGGMRRIEPKKVMAWNEFPKDLTRYRFQ